MAIFFLTDSEWQQYEETVDQFHDDAFQQKIIWRENIKNLSIHGDDSTIKYVDRELKCIVQYNHFRSWPINGDTITGEIDKESVLVFFNLKYLSSLGLTTPDNRQFAFQADLDRFVLNGVTYIARGDSQTGQSKEKPLLHFVILKREELVTPNRAYG